MITTLLLNPCIDRTVSINGFFYGQMNRIIEAENFPAGKGAHVAIAAKILGDESSVVMFGAKGQDSVKNHIESFGITCNKLVVFDNIRINTKLNNTEDNVVTEINEKGTQVTSAQIEDIIKLSIEAAKNSDYFVLSGSMPKGCDSSLYSEMMAKIKITTPDCRLVLDAEGENFSKALKQNPYIIKPNKYELEMHCDRKLENLSEIAQEGMKLHENSIAYVIISLGAQGAVICCEQGSFHAMAPKVKVVNTVGAGDCMLASSIIAISQNLDAESIIKRAVAAGCSSVSCSNKELISKEIFDNLIDKIKTKKIEF